MRDLPNTNDPRSVWRTVFREPPLRSQLRRWKEDTGNLNPGRSLCWSGWCPEGTTCAPGKMSFSLVSHYHCRGLEPNSSCCSRESSELLVCYDQPRQHIKKQRHYFADKGPSSQGYGLSSSHVWMWELDHKESWAPKNWRFWTVALEKTLECPLDCKEIQPVHPKGNQSWIVIGRTDAEAEASMFWPTHAKNWLTGKDPDAGKDQRQEEKGTTEDEMVGWHHRLTGHEFEQALGVGDGQGSLACCSPWGLRVRHN